MVELHDENEYALVGDQGEADSDAAPWQPPPLPHPTREAEFEKLRETVSGTRIPISFPRRILTGLTASYDFPDFADKIAIVEFCRDSRTMNYCIAVRAQIASHFLGLKPNSLNTNFRQHAWQYMGRTKIASDPPSVGRHWSGWMNPLVRFTRSATDEEIDKLVEYARCLREQIIPPAGREFHLNASGIVPLTGIDCFASRE
jgi:hypothetical protein